MKEHIRAFIHGEPAEMVRFHKLATIVWLICSVPIIMFLSESVPFLVFISVYAVALGHWASWQGARAERKQDENGGLTGSSE